jgi:hypothetical protein
MLQKLLIVPICSITDVDINSDNYMKRLVSLGLCFTISLIMVLGTVFSFSPFTLPNNAFADDMMGGTMGGDNGGGDNEGNNMPPPEDAPATTDALTAGGGSHNGNDDDDNDDGSGGSRNDDDNDDDTDDDDDSEPIPKDAPATTDALTAKKVECPPDQEVTLFSTTCKPAGGVESTESSTSATSAATVIPKLPSTYVPPAAALPFRGNEIELIEFYAQPVPDPDAIVRIDKVGEDTMVTFADGTIKSSKVVTRHPDQWGEDGEGREGKEAYITPGTNTPLDRLGVDRVDIPDPEPYTTKLGSEGKGPLIHYKDGSSIDTSWGRDPVHGTEVIEHKDSKGQVLETIYVSHWQERTFSIKPDLSRTDYNADGSYVTTWLPNEDGTQQFYDSKQQKLLVKDADGNIIPPKE